MNTTELARRNFELRGELAARIREIAAGAESENRDLTPDERREIDRLKDDLEAADNRVAGALGSEPREGSGHPLLSGGNGDVSRSDRGGRARGNLTRLEFDTDELRGLHDTFRSGGGGQIEARTAVVAPPMSTFGEQSGIVAPFGREPTRIADLFPTEKVESATVTAYVGSTAASAAATVAEGAQKPESSPAWTPENVPIRKIAHYVDVSTEALEDYSNFAQIVSDEMIAGVINAENTQVINGNGTPPNIKGVLQASNILTVTPGSPEPAIESVLKAITAVRTGASFVEPDAIVLNPADWEKIQLDRTIDGAFVANPTPLVDSPLSVWGVPVVLTTGISSGTAAVGNFAAAGVIFERSAPIIKVDPFSQSDYNLVRVIAEERIGLAVIRPTAVAKVTFNYST